MVLRIFTCFLATFVANGLARFGYVVLIPILILSGKLTQNQSFQLGIAILVGYIFGAFFITVLHKYYSLERVAQYSFLIIACSFFACSLDSMPFIWAWIWRFLAGLASATLMILAGPLSLSYIKERVRGSVGGFVFSGIGLGAVASGFILPSLAEKNITSVWYLLGGISFLAFVLSLLSLESLHPAKKDSKQIANLHPNFFLWLLIISYILNAIGYLPHTLFWVDYLVRDLDFSAIIAGKSWALFGIGAALGSLGSGILADKIGLKNAHIIILLCKALSCFFALIPHLFWLNISVFIMGFSTTGNVTLTNALALKIAGKEHFSDASRLLTTYFGISQAIFSLLFVYTLSTLGYFWLFVLCGVVLLASAAILIPIKDSKISHNK